MSMPPDPVLRKLGLAGNDRAVIIHIDTHIGAVMHPRFVDRYLQLGMQLHIPPLMLRLSEEPLQALTPAGWFR